jgi:hypothetical protein
MSFKIAILALLLVSVFSVHITSPKAHREEADLTGLDGDDDDENPEMTEEEAEAKAFEEMKRIFGLPDNLKEIADTPDSNPQKHKFWKNFFKKISTIANSLCKHPHQKYCPNAGTRCCDSCYPPINC